MLGRIVEARRAEVARRQRIVPEAVLRIAAQKGRSAARFCRGPLPRRHQRDRGIEESFALGRPAAAGFRRRRRWRTVSSRRRGGAFGAHRGGEFSGRAGASARCTRGGGAPRAAQGFHRRAVAGVGGARGERGFVPADRRGADAGDARRPAGAGPRAGHGAAGRGAHGGGAGRACWPARALSA